VLESPSETVADLLTRQLFVIYLLGADEVDSLVWHDGHNVRLRGEIGEGLTSDLDGGNRECAAADG